MRLILKNFRLFTRKEITWNSYPVVLVGKNGTGKTSILEALHFFATTKSFRTTRLKELIQQNKSEAYLALKNSYFLEIFLFCSKSTLYRIKTQPVPRHKFLGKLFTAVFWWGDLNLLFGSPSQRRRFLNQCCFLLQPSYLKLLSDYQKLLQQRNQALKKQDKILIKVLSREFSHLAVKIYRTRKKVLTLLNHSFRARAKKYFSLPKINYRGKIYLSPSRFLEALKKVLPSEIELGFTLVGPHRDDLEFLAKNQPARFLSQGELKFYLLLLKLSLLDLKKRKGIFLADDPLAVLDKRFQKEFFSLIKEVPTILTLQEYDPRIKGEIISLE